MSGQAIAVANLYPNVFLGSTLANVEPATVLNAMHQVGPDRVVYGSNATSAYPDLAVAGLKRLRMDPVLGEDAARGKSSPHLSSNLKSVKSGVRYESAR